MTPEERINDFVDSYALFIYHDAEFETFIGQCIELPVGLVQGETLEETLIKIRSCLHTKLLEVALKQEELPQPSFHLIKLGKM